MRWHMKLHMLHITDDHFVTHTEHECIISHFEVISLWNEDHIVQA